VVRVLIFCTYVPSEPATGLGVTREWFTVVARQLFDPKAGYFRVTSGKAPSSLHSILSAVTFSLTISLRLRVLSNVALDIGFFRDTGRTTMEVSPSSSKYSHLGGDETIRFWVPILAYLFPLSLV